jgi:uncharacterized protein
MSPGKPTRRPAKNEQSRESTPPPTVSGRWILGALATTLPAALFCTWAVFCLIFWQGSWQLLYHPTSPIARTPASVGLIYDPVSFATTEDGIAQLRGWWIPANGARYTTLYLHDQKGNLGDTVDALKTLHESGLNVLAFDYRGYGQSHFEHPTEAKWRQDTEWALTYLTGTRHIDPHSIVLIGSGLGADLALGVAGAHPELAGVVLDKPIDAPVDVVFNDPRAKLVPARLLVRDRYDLDAAAERLRVPSLWLTNDPRVTDAYTRVTALKRQGHSGNVADELKMWVAGLNGNSVGTR